jgi:hypothetical protein
MRSAYQRRPTGTVRLRTRCGRRPQGQRTGLGAQHTCTGRPADAAGRAQVNRCGASNIVGTAQGVAGCGNPLREDRLQVHS